jgi:hypothetical protein
MIGEVFNQAYKRLQNIPKDRGCPIWRLNKILLQIAPVQVLY